MLTERDKTRVNEVIADHRGIPSYEITPEKKLLEDLGMEGLDTHEMIMGIEDEFAINIPDEDAASLLTVQDVYNYVEKKMQQK